MSRSRSKAMLITGATGFVGGELLIKLLRQTASQIVCPVRAGSEVAAHARGKDRLIELLGESDARALSGRVQWVRADIEERRLGWSEATWNTIADRTAEIFHCAASVSFDLPLDLADRINVAGTAHVFELAKSAQQRHGSFIRFHHVSTAYVAGITNRRVDANYLPRDISRNFRNTYEQTKARAERLLRSSASSEVPVTIYRPSIIAGDSRTGATTNWNVLYVPMKMVARGALPAFSRGGSEIVDSIGVDFLVDAMLAYATIDTTALAAHHITAGPTAFTVSDLITTTIERAQRHGEYRPSQTKILGRGQWTAVSAAVRMAARLPKRCGKTGRKARLAQRCIDHCAVYLPYTWVNVVFNADREHDTLRLAGVEMPDGADYLETIIGYALETNFGKVPASTVDAVIPRAETTVSAVA